jgi:hypothetical protein
MYFQILKIRPVKLDNSRHTDIQSMYHLPGSTSQALLCIVSVGNINNLTSELSSVLRTQSRRNVNHKNHNYESDTHIVPGLYVFCSAAPIYFVEDVESSTRYPFTGGATRAIGAIVQIGFRERSRWSGKFYNSLNKRGFACLLQFTNSRTAAVSYLNFGGAMVGNTESHGNCVDSTIPEIKGIPLFTRILNLMLVCTLFSQTCAQYSAVEHTKANEAVWKVCTIDPQFFLAYFWI